MPEWAKAFAKAAPEKRENRAFTALPASQNETKNDAAHARSFCAHKSAAARMIVNWNCEVRLAMAVNAFNALRKVIFAFWANLPSEG
jgi:hypothetical protein